MGGKRSAHPQGGRGDSPGPRAAAARLQGACRGDKGAAGDPLDLDEEVLSNSTTAEATEPIGPVRLFKGGLSLHSSAVSEVKHRREEGSLKLDVATRLGQTGYLLPSPDAGIEARDACNEEFPLGLTAWIKALNN